MVSATGEIRAVWSGRDGTSIYVELERVEGTGRPRRYVVKMENNDKVRFTLADGRALVGHEVTLAFEPYVARDTARNTSWQGFGDGVVLATNGKAV